MCAGSRRKKRKKRRRARGKGQGKRKRCVCVCVCVCVTLNPIHPTLLLSLCYIEPQSLLPKPYLYPIPYILYPIPYTLNPYTLYPIPYTPIPLYPIFLIGFDQIDPV